MQNPDEDTEWNDILRKKGILPKKEKPEITEQQLEDMIVERLLEKQHKKVEDMTLEELEEQEDEEDERVIEAYRRQRIAEMMAAAAKSKFGEVREISANDWVDQVNKAGDGVWVILHLYKQGIPLCALVNRHLGNLSMKFPQTKFLRSISTVCIPNYPDKNLPTLFVYYQGEMKAQLIGPFEFGGMNLTQDELEWKLSKSGAIKTTLEEDPTPKIEDKMMSSVKQAVAVGRPSQDDDSSDDDDDW
uniref:Phosducin domain-containing protein n=1 Tax=Branchiostoma floridae TaxID=7739 RepID=C3YMR2_BRAFL|eukprot:XP_002602391.1 hypothetical protein BRAFLDRAFT_259621 [Branchiostoma floridae]